MNLETSNYDYQNIINEENKCKKFIKDKKEIIIKSLSKFFYYFLHLSLIAMFETMFYFFYISGQEDNGINDNVLSLTKDFSQNCKYLPYDLRNITINLLLNINDTNYIISHNNRISENNLLFGKAMNFVYAFISITLLIGILLFYFKEGRNKCKELTIDTLVIISILTVYEYNFFMYIVKNYNAITTTELEYYARNELIVGCSG
jgi:hypothetical protein